MAANTACPQGLGTECALICRHADCTVVLDSEQVLLLCQVPTVASSIWTAVVLAAAQPGIDVQDNHFQHHDAAVPCAVLLQRERSGQTATCAAPTTAGALTAAAPARPSPRLTRQNRRPGLQRPRGPAPWPTPSSSGRGCCLSGVRAALQLWQMPSSRSRRYARSPRRPRHRVSLQWVGRPGLKCIGGSWRYFRPCTW